MTQHDTWKRLAGEAAANSIEDGMVVGLGTGSTANYFVQALARRVREGLHIIGGVPSSQATRDLASSLNIPLTDLDTHPVLDVYVDGADEIDPQLNLLKGAGGALLREKIVASAAQRFVVIADISKQVNQLGQNFPVPVETTPFAVTPVKKRLEALGATVKVRCLADSIFTTENHNIILDCRFPSGISNATELDAHLHSIVGVVETGLFLHMAKQAFIGRPEGVTMLSARA
ncbi:MAG TPA: ribose-5-phosphate isomerase RpiA [Ktedonobacteraceae bacterium]|jgi:ribose 5-phosphate isomerase A|nr:ribose-5-phosphate isomerase RpiA [Ktedonobacteraceae bacterium]